MASLSVPVYCVLCTGPRGKTKVSTLSCRIEQRDRDSSKKRGLSMPGLERKQQRELTLIGPTRSRSQQDNHRLHAERGKKERASLRLHRHAPRVRLQALENLQQSHPIQRLTLQWKSPCTRQREMLNPQENQPRCIHTQTIHHESKKDLLLILVNLQELPLLHHLQPQTPTVLP